MLIVHRIPLSNLHLQVLTSTTHLQLRSTKRARNQCTCSLLVIGRNSGHLNDLLSPDPTTSATTHVRHATASATGERNLRCEQRRCNRGQTQMPSALGSSNKPLWRQPNYVVQEIHTSTLLVTCLITKLPT